MDDYRAVKGAETWFIFEEDIRQHIDAGCKILVSHDGGHTWEEYEPHEA